jgi:hypothetical protein
MRRQEDGGLSAITQVKLLSPAMINVVLGQGIHFLEASVATCAKIHKSGYVGTLKFPHKVEYCGTLQTERRSYYVYSTPYCHT